MHKLTFFIVFLVWISILGQMSLPWISEVAHHMHIVFIPRMSLLISFMVIFK